MGMMHARSRQPLHKEVAEILSERIVTGQYPEKSLLPPERALCEKHGVSRTVVREAVKLLESRGLVRIERGRGTVVQAPHHGPVTSSLKLMLRRNRHAIGQLLEVRKILETGMVALAAERRTEENLQRMEQALEVMRLKPDESKGYVDADVEFHAEIARAAQNPVLLTILAPLEELLRESRVATFSGPDVVKIRTGQHEEIYACIRSQDAAGAQAAMFRHLSDTQEDLRKHMDLNQEK
jgi:GntR family transcriptional repressor for pyruvate dehydrogenase complex